MARPRTLTLVDIPTGTLDPGTADRVFVELANAQGQTDCVGIDRAAGVAFSDRTEAGPTAASGALAATVHTAPTHTATPSSLGSSSPARRPSCSWTRAAW